VVHQGAVSLFLTVIGAVAFIVAGFKVYGPIGWLVAGASCWWLEYLTRDDSG
jgi:hypothetical protein